MEAQTETGQQMYDRLVAQAIEAAKLYYNDADNATMTDEEFDDLCASITVLERTVSDLTINPLSPTQVVGAGTPGDTRHKYPMLSLSKHTDLDKAQAYVKSLGAHDFLVQAKLDGVSMCLEYRDGVFQRALTRGDGISGEDVTAAMELLPSVPGCTYDNFTGYVRGEVVIHRDELPKGLKNARNGAAGSINHKDPKTAAKRNCRFYAFDVLGTNHANASDAILYAKSVGFTIAPTTIVQAIETPQVGQQIEAMLSYRNTLPYDTDGVVVKVNQYSARESLGSRSNSPRWAFAFKTAGETAQAKILDLKAQVGKSGTIGLVYVIEPTDLAGTTITNLTAHNFSEIRRLDVRRGDIVTIRRMGDVIPGVVCVTDPTARTGEETEFEKLTECPGCGSALEEFGNSQQLRCTGSDCASTRVRRLVHWAGRSAADIDAIGPTWIEQFVDSGLVVTPADFYAITRLDLMKFDNMGDGRATKFLESIEASKNLGLRRALIGFSMPSAGEGTASRLCKKYESIEALTEASLADLMAVEDMGVVVATSVRDYLHRPETLALIDALREHGVNLDRLPEDAPLTLSKDAAFSGKKVVVTGTLSCSRDEFHNLLQTHGGAIIAKSVSSKTDYLVVGANVGANKTNAAKKHGVEVITEETARKAMGIA